MPWKSSDNRWLEQFRKLKKYEEQHGDTSVPIKYAADKSLGVWAGTQRSLNKRGRLRADRREKLDEIGFAWKLPKSITAASGMMARIAIADDKWFHHFHKLEEYKEAHGNTLVPRNYAKDQCLSRWVYRQRALNKKGELRDNRKEMLNEIGFVWADDAKWFEQYRKLEKYKVKRRNTQVPKNYAKDKGLVNWVDTQRGLNKTGKLRNDRKELLDQIGFVWEVRRGEAKWMERYEELKRFALKHGHTRVPTKKQALYAWALRQRNLHKNSTLGDDHYEKLNKIGFLWELRRPPVAATYRGAADSDGSEWGDSANDADEEDAIEGQDKMHPPTSATLRKHRGEEKPYNLGNRMEEEDGTACDADEKVKVENETKLKVKVENETKLKVKVENGQQDFLLNVDNEEAPDSESEMDESVAKEGADDAVGFDDEEAGPEQGQKEYKDIFINDGPEPQEAAPTATAGTVPPGATPAATSSTSDRDEQEKRLVSWMKAKFEAINKLLAPHPNTMKEYAQKLIDFGLETPVQLDVLMLHNREGFEQILLNEIGMKKFHCFVVTGNERVHPST